MGGFRKRWFSTVATAAHVLKTCGDRLRGCKPQGMPNCTLLEAGLYLGGLCERPPEAGCAVLSVTPTPEAFAAERLAWRPIAEGKAPTVGWLRRQVAFIARWRRHGVTVFVHCDAGMDRSAMVVAAYWMWRDGGTAEEVVERVRRKRGVVRVSPVLMEVLRSCEGRIARRRRPADRHGGR